MFQKLNHRTGHYVLLAIAWGALCLPNLGRPGLWDIDEGLNAEAARVMLVSGNWVRPEFNGKLRTAKPALLYWMQAGCYQIFGVNEFAARFPSAIVALLTVLLAYELGRLMFGKGAGLLAGFILISSTLFCGSAHFANPDALLHGCTVLTLYLFWRDYERGGDQWLYWVGISTGLGMLAKGPVGLVLPCGVVGSFLLWSGQLRRYFRPALIGSIFLFILVAVPWYAWVSAQTKGEFIREFFFRHNVQRFQAPMENHRGPFFYYLAVLCVGMAPWSIFFLLTGWHTWKWQRSEQRSPTGGKIDPRYRFLFCWVLVYVGFFSMAATKLPNYVLPMYVPVAIAIAHFLDRWRRKECQPPAWMVHVSVASLTLTGAGVALGCLIGSGSLFPDLTRGRIFPGLEMVAILGMVPVVASFLIWWLLRQEHRRKVVGVTACCAIFFTGGLAAWGALPVDQHKAVRPLTEIYHQEKAEGEIRVGAFDYFQPSLVFYCQRNVEEFFSEANTMAFLEYPIPVYLFLPAHRYEILKSKSNVSMRELGRHYDFYKGHEVVLVTNQ